MPELGLVETRHLGQQFEEGRDEARLPHQVQVLLPPHLDDLPDFSGDDFDDLVVPVLNFGLAFEIEGQLDDPLLLGAAEVLAEQAFVVVLEAHAVQLLPQLAVFQLVLAAPGLLLSAGLRPALLL